MYSLQRYILAKPVQDNYIKILNLKVLTDLLLMSYYIYFVKLNLSVNFNKFSPLITYFLQHGNNIEIIYVLSFWLANNKICLGSTIRDNIYR